MRGDREAGVRGALGGADFKLSRVPDLRSESGGRGLARHVANANVRLGYRRGDRGNVDRTPTLVRGRVFLGDWRHVAGGPYAKPSLWFPGLAIYQFFHLALRHHY